MQLVENLLGEPSERAAYLADPSGYLPSHGFGDFTSEDVELSLRLVADTFPPALAEILDPGAGIDTIVAVDIDLVPDLLSQPSAEPAGLDDLVGDDDPFLEEDANSDAVAEGDSDDFAVEEEGFDDFDDAVSETESMGAIGTDLPAGTDSADLVDEGPESVDGVFGASIDEGFVDDEPSSESAHLDDLDASSIYGDGADGSVDDADDLFE